MQIFCLLFSYLQPLSVFPVNFKAIFFFLFSGIGLVPDLWAAGAILSATATEQFADDESASSRRRRKRSGSKASIFDEMEIFRHNGDIYAGPAMYSGSGPFLDELLKELKVNQAGFGVSEGSVNANFYTVSAGAQYRICPGFKERGFLNLLSYAVGLNYQRRGYSYKLEKASTFNSAQVTDLLTITDNIRTNYIGVPISVRLGRRLFIEAGLSLDIMISGYSDFVLERSAGTSFPAENPGFLPSFGDKQAKTSMRKVVPLVSPSFAASTGFYFNENTGIRFMANFSNAFFKANTNPENLNFGTTMLSIQLIGCVN